MKIQFCRICGESHSQPCAANNIFGPYLIKPEEEAKTLKGRMEQLEDTLNEIYHSTGSTLG